MKTKRSMTSEDWTFITQVARAAFSNPFSERRDELDTAIGGLSPDAPSDDALPAVMAKVREKMDEMRGAGLADLTGVEGERREHLKAFILFGLFHDLIDHLDRLIQSQIAAGDSPCPVPFARKVLADMSGYGLTDVEALRALAFFYQLRRAFYFIKNGLLGNSPAMRSLRKHLWNCVFTFDTRWFESRLWDRMEDFSILLLGETGTGKGAAAAAVGRSGFIPFNPKTGGFAESFTRNFVSINLSQFSEGVLESELFGHKKGAFTGAVENHEGVFSRCAPHGVIFLDEIGDVSIHVQIKLLQVLQDRTFFPVGSHQPKHFSGRVVAATNRDLDLLMTEGRFREDFYYRLCSDVVHLPALRQRLAEDPSEMDILLAAILAKLSGTAVPSRERELVRKVIERTVGRSYGWPGNVRELEQAVKRVILTGQYQPVAVRESDNGSAGSLPDAIRKGDLDAQELLAEYCRMLYQRFGTYEEVARRTNLDRRTVKKYLSGLAAHNRSGS